MANKWELYMKRIIKLCCSLFLCIILSLGICGCNADKSREESKSSDNNKNDSIAEDWLKITYQVDQSNPSQKDMDDTVYKLQKRAEIYSTEAEVYQSGSDRITVEIPDVTDADKVLEELGKSGSLEFFVASSLSGEPAEVVLTGSHVKNAKSQDIKDGPMGEKSYVVELTFTDEGAEAFGKATEEHIGDIINIAYDDEVISSPVVHSAIYDGNVVITGMESHEAAEELATMIRIGDLRLKLEKVDMERIDRNVK